jgi:hypothetical protein
MGLTPGGRCSLVTMLLFNREMDTWSIPAGVGRRAQDASTERVDPAGWAAARQGETPGRPRIDACGQQGYAMLAGSARLQGAAGAGRRETDGHEPWRRCRCWLSGRCYGAIASPRA